MYQNNVKRRNPMAITKVLSILALFLLACQAICGLHLANNPVAAADGGVDFHLGLGIAAISVVIAATISVFLAAKKTA